MPGPVPKPPGQKRHRNKPSATRLAGSVITTLPSEGRKGKPPKWPLSEPTEAEVAIWADLWKTPSAVAWERLGWTRTVARYTRILAEAEDREAGDGPRAEARQLEDRLGLTNMALLRLRWEIAPDELGDERTARKKSSPEEFKHLKVVSPT